ncbi:MAG: hypothetical protein JWN73_1032 [Betaproteobacteria bacterium]|nr:hypothetical protein [Betaproteobacteria bacterium]
MIERLRRCGAWACVGLMLLTGSASAQEGAADAVNRSSHLQMLAERIARSYAMLGQSVSAPRTQRQLAADHGAFEGDLAALRAMPLNPAQKQNLARVGEAWAGFKVVAGRPAAPADAPAMARSSAALGAATADCTAALRSKVVDRFDAIGLAGATRTLSQRMAKLYFYATWNLPAPEGAVNFKALEQEFRSSLDKLSIAPQNDDSTQADLALAQSQWVFFSSALDKLPSGEAKQQHMADVGKASDAMLEVLEGLAQKYAASKEQDWAN